MITCPNPDCRHPNADNAIYCSKCGHELKTRPQKNILELYPGLKLVPTNFYNWRKPWGTRIFFILLLMYILTTTTLIIGLVAILSGLIIFILYFVFFFKRFPKTELKTIADYVQKYQYSGLFLPRKAKRHIFFVKNGKFGVLEYVHYKVALPAQYDYLEWHTKNKYLNATVNGETFIMDINGNKLK